MRIAQKQQMLPNVGFLLGILCGLVAYPLLCIILREGQGMSQSDMECKI